MSAYLLLLVICFVSATIIPFSSELVFASFIWMGHEPTKVILVASIGNCAGVSLNYLLGKYAARWFVERVLKFDQAKIKEYSTNQQRYGTWFLLASWLPVIGDPITLYAGIVKIPYVKFAVLAYSTRIVRYIILYYVVIGLK